jgi:amino acid transporter
MRQPSRELVAHSHTDSETGTLGGLLAFTAALPLVLVSMTVPGIVVAYALGGLSAVALRKSLPFARAVTAGRRERSSRPASNGDRRAQSR